MVLQPSCNALPELGVGVVYWTELEPLLRMENGLIDVVEVEPQAFWSETGDPTDPYRFNPDVLQQLRSLPQPKLVHSVGMPIGGTVRPTDQLSLLQQTINDLQSSWASEHLSFNQAETKGQSFNTGFLLPPLQTPAGVSVAVASIQQLTSQLPVPLAIETAVNYLHPREGDLSDGEFVGAIANQANCGILLDLHNIWTNARNGRQSVEEFLSQIPLERVWEVHLAGGLPYQGYWLDAHSGLVSQELYELATCIIPALPNLRALIFEMLPIYLPQVGLEAVRSQLEKLHYLWDLRSSAMGWSRRDVVRGSSTALTPGDCYCAVLPETLTPTAWENALGAVVTRQPSAETAETVSQIFDQDPGTAVLQDLVESFRASMLVETLKLTCRLLRLHQGEANFFELLTAFWQQSPPELFASKEARAFADYLERCPPAIPNLPEVLAYELALLQAAITGQSTVVVFHHHPVTLLQALQAGRLPNAIKAGHYPVEITAS